MAVKDDLTNDLFFTLAAAGISFAVLWYVKQKISGAALSVGDALSSAAGYVGALPGQAAAAVGTAYTDSANQQADAYGTLAQGNEDLFGSGATVGTVSPWGALGDKISSWFGSSSAPTQADFPIDYGTGANDWSS